MPATSRNMATPERNSSVNQRVTEKWSTEGKTVSAAIPATFFATCLMLLLTGCADSRDQPNIILILADDVGTGDLTVYNPDSLVETPNIDSIAAAGVLFTDAHSPSSVCAPTRYSLMSGNYPWRGTAPWGAWTFTQGTAFKSGQLSLPQLLGANGYQTAMFGKVHLGAEPIYKAGISAEAAKQATFTDLKIDQPLRGGPKDLGFDYSFTAQAGIQGPPFAFFENDLLTVSESELTHFTPGEYQTETGVSVIPKIKKNWGPNRWWGELGWRSHEFEARLLNKLFDYLNGWIGGSNRQPFFIYYATSAVHAPFTPPDSFSGHLVRGQTPTPHLDMVLHLDLVVGEILNFLRDQDLIHNTLIIFASDNGGLKASAATGHRSNGDYRGYKGTVWEGGHRIPLILSWPGGKVLSGETVDSLTGLQDIYATLAELTGSQMPLNQAADSLSFSRQLTSAEAPHRRAMMFQAAEKHGYLAFRLGDQKLMTDMATKPVGLYDLSSDLSEQNNLLEDPDFEDDLERLKVGFAGVYEELLLR